MLLRSGLGYGWFLRRQCDGKNRQLTLARAEDASTADATSQNKVQSTLSSLDALLGPTESENKAQKDPAPVSPPTQRPRQPLQAPGSTRLSEYDLAKQRQARQALNFFEVTMNFDGFAPEVVNGRAAMLGITLALVNELRTGESIFAQFITGGGAAAFAIIVFVVVASLAPTLLGVPVDKVFGKDKDPVKFGPFTVDAELRNGRLAMAAFALLLLLEGGSSQAFLS